MQPLSLTALKAGRLATGQPALPARGAPSRRSARLTIRLGWFTALFSFESVFVLFLFSGQFKSDPRFAWIPGDLTTLLLALSVPMAIAIMLKRKFTVHRAAIPVVIAAFAFVAYLMLSLIWTPGSFYAVTKTYNVCSTVLWPLIAGSFVIACDAKRLRRFLTAMVVFAGWIAVETTKVYIQSGGYFDHVMGGDYLGVGRIVGLGSLITLAYLLFEARSVRAKAAAIAVLGYYVFILLISGGRGPLLATVAGMLVPMLFAFRLHARTIKMRRYIFLLLILLAAGGVTFLLLMNSGEMTQTLQRLLLLFGEGHDMGASANERASYYQDSIGYWAVHPLFGSGVGSWPIMAGFGDIRYYPHNIFLEIMVELGAVGTLLFAALLWTALRPVFPLRELHVATFALLMIFVNYFVNAQVTGDLHDNKFLFFILGLLSYAAIRKGGTSGRMMPLERSR